MVCFPYDHLDGWRGPYPPKVFAEQFEKIAHGWAAGLLDLEQAVEAAKGIQHLKTASDLSVARAVYLHFASVANQVRFVLARDAFIQANIGNERRQQLRMQIRQLAENEIELARDLFAVTNQDSRIGYEASNHYFYLPRDLMEKVINCDYVIKKLGD
jgi:hypothetical protein